MLIQRTISGLLLGAAYLAVTFFLPPPAALAVIALIGVIGLLEFYALLDAARIPNFKILGTVVGGGWIVAAWVDIRTGGTWRGLDWDMLAIFLGFFAVFVRQFKQAHNPRPLETMAGTLMGLLYVAFPMTFFVRLAMGWGGVRGRWLVLFLILVVKFTDIGAFLVGSRIGRHKLIPRISPSKTWEGCAGGIVVATVLALVVYLVSGGDLGCVRLSALHAVILGVLLSVTGILGDLAESLLKRAAGVKDSGRIIAGMGGLLDVMDSLLPTAPLLYFYARIFLAPG